MLKINRSYIGLALILLFVIIVRIRLLDVPLERDEGGYAYIGRLILHNVPSFSLVRLPPGTAYCYAVIMAIFGETTRGIHLGLLFVNLASIILLFVFSRKLMNNFAALISSTVFALLSLSSSVLGFAAHATHFVILFALGGIALLFEAYKAGRGYIYLLCGILFGLSILMKQSGIFFCFFGLSVILYIYLSSGCPDYKRLTLQTLVFISGVATPILLAAFIMIKDGLFREFWFWNVIYVSKYGTYIPISQALNNLKAALPFIIDGFYLLWLLAIAGSITVFFHPRLEREKYIILTFYFLSALSVFPGFYFREHYFILFLPALAILVGIFFDFLEVKMKIERAILTAIFILLLLPSTARQADYLFFETPEEISRKSYVLNPFPQSIEIAKYIQERTNESDTIAVFGSEPQICFYANRRSAARNIYTYSLVEKQEYALELQKEWAREIESANPKFFVSVNTFQSWLRQADSEVFIFNWAHQYLADKYKLVGVVDIFPDETIYKWGMDAEGYEPRSASHVRVYERR